MRLIDAEALIEEYDRVHVGPPGGARKLMEDAPTIEERKTGKWILVHPIQSDDPGAYMCSKCKTGMWEIRPSSYHYCPSCGADMRGEQDE